MQTRPPLERMLRIHQALQAGSFPTAESLARELEVSTKSIYRDLDFMRDRLRLPLEFDRSANGFRYTEEVKAFPTMQITQGELFALIVAEKALQQYRGTSFEKPLLSALRKMQQALPETISVDLAEVERTISFRTRAEPMMDLGIFETLAKATAARQQVVLAYRKPGQTAPEQRVVDPYHLANINGEWFLFAYDHLRNDIRTFVPSRIKAIAPSGKTFIRPQAFSLERRLRDSFGVQSGKGQFEVAIRFDRTVADYIREKKWHPSQRLRQRRGGGLELRMTLSGLAEVERWILSWGGKAIPLAPKALVDAIRTAAENILRTLGGPAD